MSRPDMKLGIPLAIKHFCPPNTLSARAGSAFQEKRFFGIVNQIIGYAIFPEGPAKNHRGIL